MDSSRYDIPGSRPKVTQYRELRGLLLRILAITDYDMGKRPRVQLQNRGLVNNRLGEFLHKLKLASDASSWGTPNDSITADASVDNPSSEGFHEDWPPFGPRDLMAFMSEKVSVGTQLFCLTAHFDSFYQRMGGLSHKSRDRGVSCSYPSKSPQRLHQGSILKC